MGSNYDSINAQLRYDTGYQDALSGKVNVGQFPTGPDGLVLPGFRAMNARYYAEKKYGADRVGGTQNSKGDFSDPNATHWYDPQYLGPIVVGASGLGAGLLGAPAAGAAGAGAAAPTSAQAMYDAGMFAGPSGTASGVAAGHAGLGTLAPVAGGAAGAAGNSLASSIKDKLLSPGGLATLATSIPALIASRSGNGATDEATNALLQEALKRSQRVDPLHQAVTQLAFSRLPDSARNGITLTGK